jgi:class 3 adenylate cyclase
VHSYAAAHHKTIMAVDIAGYNDPKRTTAHRLVVHEGFWKLMRTAFADVGIPWDALFMENTGDGAMIHLPPEVAKADLVAELPDRMLAELRRYNEVHADEANVRLRVALHAGEVYQGSNGTISDANSHAFRLLDAAEVKDALRESEAALALVVSNTFYQDVVRADPAADARSYRRIPIENKETKTEAWLRLLGGGSPAGAPRPSLRAIPRTAETVTGDRTVELTELLLDIPAVAEESSRRMLLKRLRPEIATVVAYHPQSRLHVLEIAGTCLRYRGGLAELVAAVQMLEPGSAPVKRLVDRVGNWPEEGLA